MGGALPARWGDVSLRDRLNLPVLRVRLTGCLWFEAPAHQCHLATLGQKWLSSHGGVAQPRGPICKVHETIIIHLTPS